MRNRRKLYLRIEEYLLYILKLKLFILFIVFIIKTQVAVFCDPVSDAEKIINEVSKALYFDSLEDSNDSDSETETDYITPMIVQCMLIYLNVSLIHNDIFWIISIFWWS